MSGIKKSTLNYLKKLSKNNNREWFKDNKSIYEDFLANMIDFADDILTVVNTHDLIDTASGKKSLQRIYRDTRFSKDKTPYKKHLGGGLRRATALRRGSYYFHIEPDNNFVGCGFWGPNKEDLLHIREHIAQDDSELRTILNSDSFKTNFGQLLGDQLKTSPKGFDKEHEAIDLLRYKSYIIRHDFSNEEVISDDFHLKVNEQFKLMRPFLDYMSEILTTDLNGEMLEEHV